MKRNMKGYGTRRNATSVSRTLFIRDQGTTASLRSVAIEIDSELSVMRPGDGSTRKSLDACFRGQMKCSYSSHRGQPITRKAINSFSGVPVRTPDQRKKATAIVLTIQALIIKRP